MVRLFFINNININLKPKKKEQLMMLINIRLYPQCKLWKIIHRNINKVKKSSSKNIIWNDTCIAIQLLSRKNWNVKNIKVL